MKCSAVINDGSCIRLRPKYKNHVWIYDFIEDRLRNGRKVRWLNIIDEFSKECLVSIPKRSWKQTDVFEILSGLFVLKVSPGYLRSDIGNEFTAKKLGLWLRDIGASTAYIKPGSPWENGYCESFNGKISDEFLNREIFDTMYK